MKEVGGINPYLFLVNSPVNNYDAFGLIAIGSWGPVERGLAAVLAAALAAATTGGMDACSACGNGNTPSKCLTCCSDLANSARWSALSAVAFANAACFSYVVPWKIATCIATADYLYSQAANRINKAQADCMAKCNKMPLPKQ